MSADVRTVATDALETLGTVIDEKQKRDAIHLAVEPVVAGEKLYAGDHIGITDGKAFRADEPGALGIVDPFVRVPVQPGQRFWLVVYPRKINSLRHVWACPGFPDSELAAPTLSDAKTTSETWLRGWCESHNVPSCETIIDGLMGKVRMEDGYAYGVTHEGDYLLSRGSDAHSEIPPEFWDHIEIVTGKTFERAEHFSCSC